MRLALSAMALAAVLNLGPVMNTSALAQQQQPAVPDAPTPQALPPLSGGTITPGLGAGTETATSSDSASPASSSTSPDQSPEFKSGQAISGPAKDDLQTTPPEIPAAGEGAASAARFVVIT